MKSVQSVTAILAIAGSAVAQRYSWYEKVHTGPPPASLSSFFASESAATAVPTPITPPGAPAPGPATATTVSGASNPAPLNSTPTSTAASAIGTSSPSSGENCITFTADDPSWSYSNSYPWSGSGTFGSLPGGKICLPSASAGGAMYIGSSANPGAGNTKLECYFPPNGGQSNCDISLVDGYSLSVTCTIAGASQPQIGGAVDLWTSGTCPGGNQGGVCKNTKAYDAAQSDVDQFFQHGIVAPNNYCIWWACTQDTFFNSGSDIKCHVSAGTPAAKKRELGAGGKWEGGRKHARSLEQVV